MERMEKRIKLNKAEEEKNKKTREESRVIKHAMGHFI